jgi:hypothetical protein
VNKLVVKKDELYINGSTVLVPERNRENPLIKEEYEKLRKSKIERSNRQKKLKNTNKRKILFSIVCVFILGFGLITSETEVYNSQQKLTEIKKQIADVNKDNNDLELKLVKVGGIDHIQQTAQNNLHMIAPDRKSIIYADLNKNNFAKVPKDVKVSKTKEVIERIKNLLF